MRLSQFILDNTEKILAEWEAFASSLGPGDTMDIAALRDHAHEMLCVVARDLQTTQTKLEGSEKAKGQSDTDEKSPDTPAQEHGAERAVSGFTVGQMVSEYRALRASVIRLWTEAEGELTGSDVADLVRFSESIDQALAESTSRFMEDLDHTKETFLGILGHDLRTPLGSIITSAKFMVDSGDLPPTAHMLTGRIVGSGERMVHMVDDLLDFTRGRLGASIPIVRADMDLAKVIQDAVEEIEDSEPDSAVFLDVSGNLRGHWDSARLSQVLSNLLSNAFNHGAKGTPITVTAHGADAQVEFSVHNHGPSIPQDQFQQIFNPLVRTETESRDPNHLGLGLYITQQVVKGHGGTIEVQSTEGYGTTFTVCLPRHANKH